MITEISRRNITVFITGCIEKGSVSANLSGIEAVLCDREQQTDILLATHHNAVYVFGVHSTQEPPSGNF